MCATGGQQQLGALETQQYQSAINLANEQYGNQQAILGPLVARFQSIFNAGPNQKGFSDAQLANLNATAEEGTAENYAGAARAVNEQQAGRGGGTNPLPTGADLQLQQEVANSAAKQESSQESQIEQSDYAQGLQNWENAAQGLGAAAGEENPLGYLSAENNSAGTANAEENAIASEDTGWESALIGAAGSVGSAALKK